MAKKKIDNIWESAIEEKNIEAEKKREASEFFANQKKEEPSKSKKKDKLDKEVKINDDAKLLLKQEPFEKIIEKDVLVYTSYKPIENTSGRKSINRQNDVLGAEIYGDDQEDKKWGTFGVIFSAIFAALILIPLAILAISAALVVDSVITARELMGYRVNETKFAIKHEGSGTYLQNPTYEGEQLILGSGYVDTFLFVDQYFISDGTKLMNNAKYDDFWLQSQKVFNGEYMKVSTVEGTPVWTGLTEDNTIHLNKKSEDENIFSISLNNEELFLAKDKTSNRLVLSRDEDWFSFEAQVEFITDYETYKSNYEGWKNEQIEVGVEGNSLIIRSKETGKYINSYQDVDHDVLPIFDIRKDEYKDALYLSDETDTNLFIQTNSLGEMVFSSYQTLPFDKFIPEEDSWKTYYPLLSVGILDRKPTMKLYDLSLYETTSIVGTPLENSQFYLLPNPNNLNEKAIFFPKSNSFLTTRTGVLSTERILKTPEELLNSPEDILALEFFEFQHSLNKNPEETNVRVKQTLGGVRKKIGVRTIGSREIDGYEFYGYGYDNWNDAHEHGDNFVTTKKELADAYKDKGKFKLTKLRPNSAYVGVVAVYREKDAGVGKHVTFEYVPPFKTKDPGISWPSKWPNLPSINWPDEWPDEWPEINWPWIDTVDPGDPEVGTPTTTRIWDSTDEENDHGPNDVPVNGMLVSASNEIEISIEVTQGEDDGVTDKLGIQLEEVDSTGVIVPGGEVIDVIVTNDRPITNTTYTYIFRNLEPEKNYLASVVLYDHKDRFVQTEEDGVIELDSGSSQMYATTERIAPVVDEEKTGYNFDTYGLSVHGTFVEGTVRPTDSLMIRVENVTTAESSTTGWIQLSDWSTATVTDWTFTKNPSIEYYEATYIGGSYLDNYSVNVWIKMDTNSDFKGWDETSPAFDENYNTITGDSQFGVIEVLTVDEISSSSFKLKHISISGIDIIKNEY